VLTTIDHIKALRTWQNRHDLTALKVGDLAPNFEPYDVNGENSAPTASNPLISVRRLKTISPVRLLEPVVILPVQIKQGAAHAEIQRPESPGCA
jgi:hypothetical protein